ncbi:TonB-dependent receptor [Stenotrophomonas sp. 24(2023)]|uniref:TonB-dependent receptor n=1 Tax=Stenotrophomonas sp. 24(2023) TaxID=3068324 RepID=UPI0027E01368|nr:TonB-dependent receptor [Stenotrophomonas sp. 24(2023)]WMJ68234.1 TonB-dependent receptor [Stenotrophomonas sp. 24(2023)]
MTPRPARSLLSLAILSTLSLPTLALAQQGGSQAPAPTSTQQAAEQPTATNLDTVVVTALRQSLQTAQSMKQEAEMVVDSIVAEDIGKLPDNSVADALQRVTGVQIAQGTQGETTGVVIRGLPNVISTLNGREIFSSSGRGYAFQNLPATAIKSLNVYKSSEASLPLGGIAGLVDIELRRPLDFDGLQIAGTATGTHSKYGGDIDPSASLLLSNRWDTDAGEFGAMINAGYIGKRYAYDAVWGDFPKVLNNSDGTPMRTASGDLIAAPNGWGAAYNQGDRKRSAFNYALQWKPSERTEVYVEGLYDYVRDNYDQAFFFTFPVGVVPPSQLQVGNNCYANQLAGPLAGQTICDATSGTWTGDTYAASSTQAHKQRGQDIQNAIGFKWRGDQLQLSTEFTRTSGYYRDENFIIDTFLRGPITTVWDGTGGQHQNWSLAGNPAMDPSRFYLNGLFQTWGQSRGEENSWRGDGRFEFLEGPIANLQFGLRYADRNASARGSVEINTPPPGGAGSGNITATPNPANQVVNLFPASGFFCSKGGNAALNQSFLTPCYDYLIGNADALRAYYGLPAGLPGENPGRFFDIQERKSAGYLQAKYDFELFGLRVDGLVGVRAEKIKRELNAFSFDASTGVYSAITRNTQDTNTLPNASLNLHFNEAWQLRFVAAKTLSYPDFGALNPSISLNPGTVNRAGVASSGNPDLSPIKSTNYDASLEWYFSPVGYASAGVFYRDINGYIQNYITNVNIGGQAYELSSPQSAGSGHLQGVELAYQQTFDFLPGAWSGLGAQLNYTYIEGNTRSPEFIGGPVISRPLQNVSKNNYNAVLFYENFGLSARLAYGYRSRYIDFFTQPTVAGTEDQVEPASSLDFSVSYDVTPRTTVVFSATNLLGNNLHQYWGSGNSRPRDIRFQDKTLAMGVRFKL